MIYFWVALGGALGSVARFWLSNAMTSVAGAQFPWGTLLVNIIGSFVIGFFGLLTTRAARFAMPPEMAVFVMAGICGGFTTFSSFSLQTVQLARAGEWERALAYIAASLILCVLLCWLGMFAALAVTGRHEPQPTPAAALSAVKTAEGRPGAPGMVLALLPDARSAESLLDPARSLAGLLDRPLAALHVRIDPVTTILPSEEVLTLRAAAEIAGQQAALASAVTEAVAAWTLRTGVPVVLFEPLGEARTETARAGAGAAAIVAPLAQVFLRRWGNPPESPISAAIFNTGAPVLIMPENTAFRPDGHLAIAWKDAGHARAAVAAAMPMAARAAQISIIGVGDAERLRFDRARALLGPNAARARIINPPRGAEPVGETLLAQARAAGADTLVLGAHRHGHLADWILGGVTASVLASAEMPLFMKQ